MTDYRNDSQVYPLVFKDKIPGISLPLDFNIEPADPSLIPEFKEPKTTTAPKPLAVTNPPTTLPIRFPIRDVSKQGAAIARLVGAFSGPGFNVIFRPHGDKALGKKFEGLTLPGPDLLELNLTHELWTFPSVADSLGDIPNRVAASNEKDVFLQGIAYTQLVRDVTATTGKFEGKFDGTRIPVNRLGVPLNKVFEKDVQDIHFEPGLFVLIPATGKQGEDEPQPLDKATISRMASIPHGTTINAQGAAAVVDNSGTPLVIPTNKKATRPFTLATGVEVPFPEFTFTENKTTRIPQNLEPFRRGPNPRITPEMLEDPVALLNTHNAGKRFSQIITFTVSTLAPATKAPPSQTCPHLASLAAQSAMKDASSTLENLAKSLTGKDQTTATEVSKVSEALKAELAKLEPPPIALKELGGPANRPSIGTANIAFLDGVLPGAPNASTGKVESTFWISTVLYTINVDKTYVPQKGADGKFINVPIFNPIKEVDWDEGTLPAFVFPADKEVQQGVYEVEATQIQYAQTVLLNFNGLAWPHISVATVVPIRPILVNFAKRLE